MDPVEPSASNAQTKPPRIGVNLEWVAKGAGWDCREVYYVGNQRKRRRLGHLGSQLWEQLQREYAGPELEDVLRDWVHRAQPDFVKKL